MSGFREAPPGGPRWGFPGGFLGGPWGWGPRGSLGVQAVGAWRGLRAEIVVVAALVFLRIRGETWLAAAHAPRAA